MRKTIIAIAAAGLALAGALSAQGQTSGGWREVDPENILIIETSKGRIIAELMPNVAPKTVERIKTLTRQGLYDGRAFFRVIDDFMAQTGDPMDTGQGASALPDIEAEFSFRRGPEHGFVQIPNARGGVAVGFVGVLPVRSEPDAQMAITADGKVRGSGLHCPGVLGMARSDDPNSGNSQFYFMRQKADPLNGRYTAFGRVLKGLDVVRAIKYGDPASGAVPEPRDTMTKVRIMADLPAAERPAIRVQSTASNEFKAGIQSQTKTKGATIDICDLDIPVSVQ